MPKLFYPIIKEKIESLISEGKWVDKLPSVHELAAELGANHQTVSKAIKLLEEEGKLSIRGVRGTFINSQNDSRRHYNNIGLLGFCQSKGVTGVDFQEIQKVTASRGAGCMCILNDEKSIMHLAAMPMDGMIFTNSILNGSVIDVLQRDGMSFVSMNRIDDIPGVSWIDYDTELALETGVEYLVDSGCKNIATVSFKLSLDEHARRISSCLQRLYKRFSVHGNYYANSYLMDFFRKYGEDCTSIYGAVIAEELLKKETWPLGIFVNHIELSQSVADKLTEKGKVPGIDFRIVSGFERERQYDHCDGIDALIVYDRGERARNAAQMLFRKIENPSISPEKVLLKPEFVTSEELQIALEHKQSKESVLSAV